MNKIKLRIYVNLIKNYKMKKLYIHCLNWGLNPGPRPCEGRVITTTLLKLHGS